MRCGRFRPLLAALAVGCGAAVAPPPGSFSVAMISDPHSFNPCIDNDVSTNAILGRVFDGLVETVPPDYRVVPVLADTWSVSPDGRTWTFRLRRDVLWSDGVPFTSADVLFTYREIVYSDSIVTSLRDAIQMDGKPFEVSAPDTWTVAFTTPRPFAPFLRSIGVPIVPRHRLEAAVRAGTFSSAWAVNAPPSDVVGTGPFRILEYVPGGRVVLAPNLRYGRPGTDERFPRLARLVFKIVPDVDAPLLWFLAGAIDATGLSPVDVPLVKTLIRDGRDLRYHDRGPATSITFLSFNVSAAAGLPPHKIRWFRDLRFRRAVAHAVDQKGILETVYNGLGYEQDGPVERANKVFYTGDVPRHAFDPARAEALLDEMGLRRGADGVRRDAEGREVSFEIMTNAGNNERVRIATLVQENLKRVGVRASVSAVEWNTMLNRLDVACDWDGVIIGLKSYSVDPHDGSNVYRSDGSLHLWNQKPPPPAADAPPSAKAEYERHLPVWRAGVFPWEREIDQIMDAEATTLDEARRIEIFHDLQRTVAANLPMIYFPSVASIAVAQPRLRGYDPDPYLTGLHNAWEVSAE